MKNGCLLLILTSLLFVHPFITHANENKLSLTSPDFSNGGFIPSEYTCDGKNINPQLLIKNVPKGTKSLVLIIEDPDAPSGVWIHWLLWNIKPTVKIIKHGEAPSGAVSGINDFGNHGYGGPCPPWGTHRYLFKLFALDTILNIKTDAKKQDIENAMKSHIISHAELIGLYKKK